VGVEVIEGRVFPTEVPQDLDQHQVFEDVGVVAGVESVAVAQQATVLVCGIERRIVPRTPAASAAPK